MSRARAPGDAPYGELVRQYVALRDAHPGIILLARVGAFYEVLFDDAELVARELGLKLTERPSGGAAPPVPQCGFAHHALDTFLPRLLARGYRVAVGDERDQVGRSVLAQERGVGDGPGREGADDRAPPHAGALILALIAHGHPVPAREQA